MANQEQLDILRQGVEVWNQWREENPEVRPDLSGVDLSRADLRWTDLSRTDLSKTGLSRADLSRTGLREANLSKADLRRADLSDADLREVNLSRADIREANLSGAHLREADLSGADLTWAHLREADLRRAVLDGATVGWSVFGNVDLSEVRGLDTIRHRGPSTIGVDTIYRSRGNIPEVFLRGAGVPENLIIYMASLTGKAREYYTCFISYSSKDQKFADRLHADLQNKGVRCWFAPEDMKIGSKIRQTVDEAIRLRDKLLLILSENALNSDWVEDEVEAAFEEERRRQQTVLFPIRLDDTVMESNAVWAGKVRQRHIGDFTHWKEHESYQQAFERLLSNLKAEGQK